jgi:hypothetical protein
MMFITLFVCCSRRKTARASAALDSSEDEDERIKQATAHADIMFKTLGPLRAGFVSMFVTCNTWLAGIEAPAPKHANALSEPSEAAEDGATESSTRRREKKEKRDKKEKKDRKEKHEEEQAAEDGETPGHVPADHVPKRSKKEKKHKKPDQVEQ